MASIFEDALRVKVAFEGLQTAAAESYNLSSQQELTDTNENFLLWASNLGAFDSGHSSLDYRLQDVPETAELVRDLLQDLVWQLEALQDSCPTNNGDSGLHDTLLEGCADEGESGSKQEDLDELQATLISVKDILRRLFRIARSIRNYGTRSAPGRRDVYKTVSSGERQAVKEQLIAIERRRISDYVYFSRKGEHNGFMDSAEDIPFDDHDLALIDRLAKACSQRRQQFVFWRYRHENSTHAIHHHLVETAGNGEGGSQMQTGGMLQVPTSDRFPQAPSMPSSVTKIRKGQIDLAERVSVASGISRPPSAKGLSGQRVEWPAAPEALKELSRGQYFECPYCFNFCPKRYKQTPLAWKAHLIHDLMPYNCTYPKCDTADQLYDSWADWMSHEMLVHQKVWICLEHTDQEFSTPEHYCAHLQQAHREDADDMSTTEAVSARATGSNRSGRHCPFCMAEILATFDMQRHIAWHLESIALGNLPRSTGFEQGSEEGDLDSQAQKMGDADSRKGELDDVSLPNESSPGAAKELTPEAGVMHELAGAYQDNGQVPEAVTLPDQVVQIEKQTLSGTHSDQLASQRELARAYRANGRVKEAAALLEEVVKIQERSLAEDHPDRLASQHELAGAYEASGQVKDAVALLEQVMEIRKTKLGADHPDTLTSMANLASTYRNQGRWTEAEELQVQVMETFKMVLGEEHPDTLTSMTNLASTYRNQGRWDAAEELEVQVMEAFKRVLGPEHPDTMTSMTNLASTYRNQGRWDAAEELQVHVIEMSKKKLGADHPDTLTSMTNLASTYRNQGRWDAAEELQVHVIEMRKRVLGEQHPDTLTSMANLASTYRNQGRWTEAEELQVHVIEMRKRVLGEGHPSTLTSMNNLAFTFHGQGRNGEAIMLMSECVRLQNQILGAQHPDTLGSSEALAQWQGRE